MANKLYLHRATSAVGGTLPASTASVSATAPTWTPGQTNSTAATPLLTNRVADAAIGTVAQTNLAYQTDNVTTGQRQPLLAWVSEPLKAQTFPAGQAIGYFLAGSESAAQSEFFVTAVIAVWRPSNGTLVGRIHDGPSAGGATAEPGTTQTALSYTASGALVNAVTCQQGDVLVIELWRAFTAQTMATAYTNIIYYDGRVEGSITDNAAYIEFATDVALMSEIGGNMAAVSSAGVASKAGTANVSKKPGKAWAAAAFDTPGIVNLWDFEESAGSFLDWVGGFSLPIVGTGTVRDVVTPFPGIGDAVTLPGIDNTKYLGFTNSAPTFITGMVAGTPFSVEWWVSQTTTIQYRNLLCTDATDSSGLAIQSSANGNEVDTYIGGSGFSIPAQPPGNAVNGVWHHYVFTYDPAGATFKSLLYINGVLNHQAYGNGFRGIGAGLHRFQLGTAANTNTFWGGSVAGLAFYTSVLTPAQVADHLRAGVGGLRGVTVGRAANTGVISKRPKYITGTSAGNATVSVGLNRRLTDEYGLAVQNHPNAVAYWRLGDVNTSDALDSAKGLHNGAYSGNVQLAPGAIRQSSDQSRVFGPGKLVIVQDFPVTGAFSVEAWFKMDTWAGTGTPIINRRTVTNEGGFSIESDDTTGRIWFHVYSGGTWHNVQTQRPLAVGMWHHIVVTYDGVDNGYIFINGGYEVGAGGLGAISNAGTQYIQIGRNVVTGECWPGNLDEVALYNAGLDLATIRDHWRIGSKSLNAYEQAVEGTTGLVAYWPLNEVAGPNAFDESGGGHTMDVGTGVTMLARPGSSPLPNLAASYDNTGESYIWRTVADTALDVGNGDFSVEVWTYQDVATIGPLFEYGDVSINGFHIWQYPDPAKAYVNFDSNTAIVTTADLLDAGKWHHIVATRSGTTCRVYVDGVLAGTLELPPATYLPTNRPVLLGYRVGGSLMLREAATPLDAGAAAAHYGFLDQVAVYSVALTPAQILDHYGKGGGGISVRAEGVATTSATLSKRPGNAWAAAAFLTPGVVHLWDFEEVAGTFLDWVGGWPLSVAGAGVGRGLATPFPGLGKAASTPGDSFNNYIGTADSPPFLKNMTTGTAFSYEFWFNHPVGASGYLLYAATTTTVNGHSVLTAAAGISTNTHVNGGQAQTNSQQASNVIGGVWHQCAFVYDPAAPTYKYVLYINGVVSLQWGGSTGMQGSASAMPFRIGTYPTSLPWAGSFAGLAYYSTPLTLAQVAAHYRAGIGGIGGIAVGKATASATIIRGVRTTPLPLVALTDNFEDGVPGANWTVYSVGGTGGTTIETGGTLQTTPPANAGVVNAERGYRSVASFDMAGKGIQIELVAKGSVENSSAQGILRVELVSDPSNRLVEVGYAGTQYYSRWNSNSGGSTWPASTRFLRLEFDKGPTASGKLYFDYSTNGITWFPLPNATMPVLDRDGLPDISEHARAHPGPQLLRQRPNAATRHLGQPQPQGPRPVPLDCWDEHGERHAHGLPRPHGHRRWRRHQDADRAQCHAPTDRERDRHRDRLSLLPRSLRHGHHDHAWPRRLLAGGRAERQHGLRFQRVPPRHLLRRRDAGPGWRHRACRTRRAFVQAQRRRFVHALDRARHGQLHRRTVGQVGRSDVESDGLAIQCAVAERLGHPPERGRHGQLLPPRQRLSLFPSRFELRARHEHHQLAPLRDDVVGHPGTLLHRRGAGRSGLARACQPHHHGLPRCLLGIRLQPGGPFR